MDFYTSIADYYDYIFQVRPAQISFVKSELEEPLNNNVLLEVGCGTGNLSIELAKFADTVDGIDLDEEMLDKAKKKTKEKNVSVNYQCLNMLDLSKSYSESIIDGVICFGNTLVHLKDEKEILTFLKEVRTILKSQGKLLLQIINYDRIIDNNIEALPIIDNENIKFQRNYKYDKEKNKLDFKTILTIKKENKTIKNNIPLYPIRRNALERLLKEAGFNNVHFYGGFDKVEVDGNNIPYVISCDCVK